MNERAHFYQRKMDPQGSDSLARLSRWVPHGATVLELGPGSGYFTRYLAEHMNCTVDAIERDPCMAEHVRPWCRRLIIADIDTWQHNDADLLKKNYHCIVLADVLEHLQRPAALLRSLKALLAPKGQILISVPNIAYAGLIADLAMGDFEYREEGLLDRTHIHFFTRRSLFAMLEEAGLHVWSCEGVSKPLAESEFSARIETVSMAMRQVMTSMPDAFCYQWLVAARQEPALQAIAIPEVVGDMLPVRLFWSVGDEPFSYINSVVTWITTSDNGVVTADFTLPTVKLRGIRLRLSDRPGYLHLYSLELLRRDGSICWHWSAEQEITIPIREAMHVVLQEGGVDAQGRHYVLAVIHNGESWLEPTFGVAVEEAAQVRMTLHWSMSSDYQAARRGWERATIGLQLQLDKYVKTVANRDREITYLEQKLQVEIEKREKQGEILREDQALLRYRTSWRGWLRWPLSKLKKRILKSNESPDNETYK